MFISVSQNTFELKPKQELKPLNLLFFFIVFIPKYAKLQDNMIEAAIQ